MLLKNNRIYINKTAFLNVQKREIDAQIYNKYCNRRSSKTMNQNKSQRKRILEETRIISWSKRSIFQSKFKNQNSFCPRFDKLKLKNIYHNEH